MSQDHLKQLITQQQDIQAELQKIQSEGQAQRDKLLKVNGAIEYLSKVLSEEEIKEVLESFNTENSSEETPVSETEVVEEEKA